VSQFLLAYCDLMYATLSMLSTWRDQSHKSVTQMHKQFHYIQFLVKRYNTFTEIGNHSGVNNVIVDVVVVVVATD